MQKSLFEDFEEPQKELKIVAKKKAPLSKLQLDFNRLTEEIKKMEQKIESEKLKIDKIRTLYSKEISPAMQANFDTTITFVKELHGLDDKYKLSKLSKEYASEVIEYLLDELFSQMDPTPELIEIYDQHAIETFAESLEAQKSYEKDMFSSFFKDTMDLDINLNDFGDNWDPSDPQVVNKIREMMDEKQREFEGKKTKKKSKKQLGKEANQKAEEQQQIKNIRSIYIALTKVIHPDAEPDPERKKEKEEVMKMVVAAYEQKDLTTLLRLEMEWLNKSTDELFELPEEKLKHYISSLKERLDDLKENLELEYMHPRNHNIRPVVHLNEKIAIKKLKEEKMQIEQLMKDIKSNTKIIQSKLTKTEVNKILKDLHRQVAFVNLDYFDGNW